MADPDRPILDGVRVIDFSRYIAGPYCAAVLGDLGAEVIRVEPPGGGQDRWLVPFVPGREGAIFLQLNRNKKSVALDLGTPEGRFAAEALVRGADIVVTNMPPGALARAGLDHPALTALRADIISVNVSGFGRAGPLRDRPCFDAVGQAMSGAAHLGGAEGQPSRAGCSYVDYGTGMAAAAGALAALLHRRATGAGQAVDAALFATAHAVMNPAHIEAAALGRDRAPVENRGANSAPSDLLATRDGFIVVQAVGNSMFRRWCAVIGRPDLAHDPRFASDGSRARHGVALSEAMANWSRDLTRAEALAALGAAGIPCGPVRTPGEAAADPATWDSGIFEPVRHPDLPGDLPVARLPLTLSRMPHGGEMRFAAPGEHTEDVLAAAGLGAGEIAALCASATAAGPGTDRPAGQPPADRD